jgi:hypothetical protein
VNLTLDVKQRVSVTGGSSETNPPLREVPHSNSYNPTESSTDTLAPPADIMPIEVHNTDPGSIFTRDNDPRKPERVARIIKEVTVGPDVTQEQRQSVESLLEEFADCFALSLKEINAIPGAVHKLNIPEGSTFRTKIPPRSFNPDQRAFVNAKVDEMLEAGIIRPIHPSEVRFVAQTVLAQKAHDGQGLCIDQLKHIVNDQCLCHGIPNEFEMPPQPDPMIDHPTKPDAPRKWRM